MEDSGIARGELTKTPSSLVKTSNCADRWPASGSHSEIRWALKDLGRPTPPDLPLVA